MDCLSNVYVRFIFVLFIIHGGNAALLQTCADNEACKATGGDPNAICSTDINVGGDVGGNCICTGSFKVTNGVCVANGNGDPCIADSDCAGVTNSACETDKTCGCADGYKITSLTCSAVLGGACTADSDCTEVVDAGCDKPTSKCACIRAFKPDKSGGCTAKGNGDPCTADSDCAALTNSACETDKTCGCADGYKITSTTCTAVLGTTCTGATDCTAHVQNSECLASKECSCLSTYIQDGNVCAKELGQECSTGQCVTNAECDTKCKCSDGYVDTNGLCAAQSSAVTKRLAISVAVMSILCIVQNIF